MLGARGLTGLGAGENWTLGLRICAKVGSDTEELFDPIC
jgi:hypothetical protein